MTEYVILLRSTGRSGQKGRWFIGTDISPTERAAVDALVAELREDMPYHDVVLVPVHEHAMVAHDGMRYCAECRTPAPVAGRVPPGVEDALRFMYESRESDTWAWHEVRTWLWPVGPERATHPAPAPDDAQPDPEWPAQREAAWDAIEAAGEETARAAAEAEGPAPDDAAALVDGVAYLVPVALPETWRPHGTCVCGAAIQAPGRSCNACSGAALADALGFSVEQRGDVYVVRWDNGGTRPASSVEAALWAALAAARAREGALYQIGFMCPGDGPLPERVAAAIHVLQDRASRAEAALDEANRRLLELKQGGFSFGGTLPVRPARDGATEVGQ